jgi:hypothetical protein
MSKGSGGPWTSPGAQVSAQPHEIDVETPGHAEPSGRIPPFPAERLERGIQQLSRFAGPAVFFLALGGIVWWVVK